MNFKIAEVVRLISGSPALTVVRCNQGPNSDLTACVWFTKDGMFQTANIPSVALTRPLQERAPHPYREEGQRG